MLHLCQFYKPGCTDPEVSFLIGPSQVSHAKAQLNDDTGVGVEARVVGMHRLQIFPALYTVAHHMTQVVAQLVEGLVGVQLGHLTVHVLVLTLLGGS